MAFGMCQFGKANSLARREASDAANSKKRELLFLNQFSTKNLGNFEHLQPEEPFFSVLIPCTGGLQH